MKIVSRVKAPLPRLLAERSVDVASNGASLGTSGCVAGVVFRVLFAGIVVLLASRAGAYELTSGWNHTCALDDHGVACWGWNNYGQSDVPFYIVNPTAVVAGGYHSCAIDDNGVVCWGRDQEGQSDAPAGLVNPIALEGGNAHTCAIDDNGVTCWGDNFWGQTSVPWAMSFCQNTGTCPAVPLLSGSRVVVLCMQLCAVAIFALRPVFARECT